MSDGTVTAKGLTPGQLAEACAEALWSEDNASKHLGIVVEEVIPGQSRLSMVVRDFMTNGHNICHGGFIFTLADSAFAYACNTYNQNTVAQHCSVTFLAPVREGERLTAVAREINRGGRGGIYDIRVTRDGDEAVAEFRGHARTIRGTHLPEGD